MQNYFILKRDLKTFAIISFSTGIFIILFSLVGHLLTPAKLIPSSFIGGTIGLFLGCCICFKLNYIDKADLYPVLLCSLISFGIVSFIVVFNFNKPLLIFSCFFLVGLTAIISNHYFITHDISTSKIYGTIGLTLAFPALYFVIASVLKFQFGHGFLFNFFDSLLHRTNGQANFNAITPFIFGGGLLLAFGLNLFSQIEVGKTNASVFSYKILRIKIKTLNLIVLIMTGVIGLAILSYLAVENLK